jgi:hypothetical protein
MRSRDFSAGSVRDWLAFTLAWVLGFGCAGAIGLGLILAGDGALILGLKSPARMGAALLFLLAALSTRLFAKLLRPLLGKDKRDSGSAEPGDALPRWMPWVIGAGTVLFVAAAVAQTLRHPDGNWDAWAIWNARARSLYRTAGDVRLACSPLRNLAGFTAHPEYPLLLPTVIAIGWTILGGETKVVPALLSILPMLLVVAIAALTVARTAKPRGAWVAAILLTTPMLSLMAQAQYAEAMLGALLIAGLGLLATAWDTNDWHANDSARARFFALAGLAFGLAGLVKHEGHLFLGAASLVVAISRPRDLLPMALGTALPLAMTLWFQLGFAPPGDLAQGPLGVEMLWRLGPIAFVLARRVVYFQGWALHLLAFLIALGIRWRTNDLALASKRLLLVCALVLGGFVAAFLTTAHGLVWHLNTSIDRLILQLWPALVVALAIKPGAGPSASPPART